MTVDRQNNETKPTEPQGAPSALTALAMAELDRFSKMPATPQTLETALRFLAKWRAALIENTLVKRSGTRVLTGPFAGMDYSIAASEGARTARLLGCYEASLAPVFETVIAKKYRQIIDIGCAEGYYAVGLAMRLPKARVLARDQDPAAQAKCRDHAARNGVADRVEVGGAIGPADFDWCRRRRTFVLCDIEGAEAELMDPAKAPGLTVADILVECHPHAHPGLADVIAARFAPTHKITRIGRSLSPQALPEWMEELSDMDRLIALWEWRSGPTPWLWMEAI